VLTINFYRTDPKGLRLYVDQGPETASLKAGAIGNLTTGDGVVYVEVVKFPSGDFAEFVAAPGAKINRATALAVADHERADIEIKLARAAGPIGAAAAALRAPLGAYTAGGKVLRAADMAESEGDPSKRAVLAAEARRLAYDWSRKAQPLPAPALADVKKPPAATPAGTGGGTTVSLPNLPTLPSLSFPALGVGLGLAVLAVVGYLAANQEGEGEDEDD